MERYNLHVWDNYLNESRRTMLELGFFAREIREVYLANFGYLKYEVAVEKLVDIFSGKSSLWGEITSFRIHLLIEFINGNIHALNPILVSEFLINHPRTQEDITLERLVKCYKGARSIFDKYAEDDADVYKAALTPEGNSNAVTNDLQQLCRSFEKILRRVEPRLMPVMNYVAMTHDLVDEFDDINEEQWHDALSKFYQRHREKWGAVTSLQLNLCYSLGTSRMSPSNPLLWLAFLPEYFSIEDFKLIESYYTNLLEAGN